MQVHALSYDLDERRWSARFPAGDSPRTLVTAFGAPDLVNQPDVLVEVARAYPRSLVIGCSTAGEIHGTSVRDRSLAVAITRFDRTDLQLVSVDSATVEDSQRAGEEIGRKLAAKPGLRAVLALCDGLSVDGAVFSRALGTAIGPGVVITGGLAADGLDFKQTWLTVGGAVKRGVSAAVGLYGPHVVIGHGISSDWIPFASEWVITRSEGNFIYELDYRPAIDVYRTALADRGDELPDVSVWFPISVHTGTAAPVVRAVIGIDEADGALVLAGEVRNGQSAQLLTADLENLIEGGARAASAATRTGAPVSVDCLALAVSCFARRKILGLWSGEEISSMREGLLAQRTTMTGFYGYGQISPTDGAAALHNQTLSLTVFSEARATESAAARAPRAAPPPIPQAALAGYSVRGAAFDAQKSQWVAALPDLDSARTLVLAFGASQLDKDKAPFDALFAKYPTSVILGCSTAGEIHDAGVRDQTMSVSVTRFARTDVRLAVESVGTGQNVRQVAKRVATTLAGHPGLRAVLVLSEGLHVNGSELVRGLNDVFGGSIPVVGGLAGDGMKFGSTWVLAGREIYSNAIAAVGLYGNYVVVGTGVRGGWDRFGLKRTVTKSEGNVLFELDGRPALQIYKEYLGERAIELPAAGLSLPLAVRDPVTEQQSVRTLVGIDEAAASLTFAGDVPTGHIAQFMKADVERLINGATHAALMANESGPPAALESLVVAISCVGRRHMMGAHTEEELEAIAETFRSDRVRIGGFYSYGEIGPSDAQGMCELHNQSLSLLVVSESMTPVVRGDIAKAVPVAIVEPATRPTVVAKPTPAASPVDAAETQPLPVSDVVAPPVTAAVITKVVPASPPSAPRGPIVRVPRSEVSEIGIEESDHGGAIHVIRIRGRITEAFKGDVAGRLLRGRVVLDLGDIHRVTSFGVREWLAMFSSATELTECYLARCSESVVNQLTMIRAFDGGAKLLSFFAPYLCEQCNKPFERLFDVELDAVEIAKMSPEQVRCPRCNGYGRFDDDPRSYFAFPGAHFRSSTAPDINAVHAALCSQDQVRAAEDVETIIEGDIARVRVIGRLSLNIRWRRVLENIDGYLVVDLSSVTAVEPSGVQGLDFHLRTVNCRKPVGVEHAPPSLLERLVSRPARDIEIRSTVVNAFCSTCSVGRTASIRFTPELIAGARPPAALCKRCDARLELRLEPSFDQYLASLRMAQVAPVALVAAAGEIANVATARAEGPPPRVSRRPGAPRSKLPVRVLLITGGVVVVALAAWGITAMLGNDPPPKPRPLQIVDVVDAPASEPMPKPHALPPGWADRTVTNDRNSVFLVGSSTVQDLDGAIAGARRDATAGLIQQLYIDLAGTPVHRFLATRVGSTKVTDAAQARFDAHYGKLAHFQRVDLAEVALASGRQVYVRFELPRQSYNLILAAYRDTQVFRGLTVCLMFPLFAELEDSAGNMVVIDVAAGSVAETNGIKPGDIVRRVGDAEVASMAAFRTAIRKPALTLEVETAEKSRRVQVGDQPPPEKGN